MNSIIFMVSLLGVFADQIAPANSGIWLGTKIGEIHGLIMNFTTCMTHAGTFPPFDVSTPEGRRLDNIRRDMDRLSRCSIFTVVFCGPINHIRATFQLMMLLLENPFLVKDVAASPFRCAFKLMCLLRENIPFLRCDEELDFRGSFPLSPSSFGNINYLRLPPYPTPVVVQPYGPPAPDSPYGQLNLQGSGIPYAPNSPFPGPINGGVNLPPFVPPVVPPFPQGPTPNGFNAVPQFPDLSHIMDATPPTPPQSLILDIGGETTTTTEKTAKDLSGFEFNFEKDLFLDKEESLDSASSKKLDEVLGLS